MFGRLVLRRALVALLVLSVLTPLLGLLYVFFLFDWNNARDPLASSASARAGRKIVIEGDLRVDWGWPISRLSAEGLAVDNFEGGSAPQMLEIKRIDAALDLRSLLKGQLKFTELALVAPRLLLEKTAKGTPNWRFVDNPAGGVALAVLPENRHEFPIIERLSIDDGRMRYKDPANKTDLRVGAATLQGAADDDQQRIRFNGKGLLQGQPLRFKIEGGSVLELRDSHAPYPLSVSIDTGDTSARIAGTITDPVAMKGLDVRLSIRGHNAADLFTLTGIALLPTPPYDLAGRLGYADGVWAFRKFSGRMGGSDLAGDLRWDVRPKRPLLTASFTSHQLDLADLSGFIGVRLDAQSKSETRILPDVPLDISRLAAMDAQVDFHGVRIVSTQLPVDDVHVKIDLEDRLLKVVPVRFGSGRGDIAMWVTVNAREEPVQITSKLEVRRVPIAAMFKGVSAVTGKPNLARGVIGGTADLAGNGKSLRTMLANASGHLGIGMEGGQLSHLIVELLGLDIAESVGYLLAGDKPVPIRCVIADFNVTDGRMKPQALVIDTDDTVVTGEGEINLKDESLDLELKPAPKDFSPLALRSPLIVRGTLKNPEFSVKRTGLLARGAAAAVLTLVFPPAAILAFLEPGLGEDSQCAALLADMAQRSQNPRKNERLVPENR